MPRGATAEAFEPTADYVDHPELKSIATDLIRRNERFQLVAEDLRIAYLARLGEPSGEGEGMLAACVKASPLWRDVAEYDVVIWCWDAVWAALEPRQREALTAHELCHIGRNDKGAVKLRKHDLEEFAWVARQYGRWDDAIAHFAGALQLHDEDAAKKPTPIRRPGGREQRRPGTGREGES